MYPKLAEVALALIGRATMAADDQSIETVWTVRKMLKDIVAGQLLVAPPSPAAPAEAE